jgi:hypothetical protein
VSFVDFQERKHYAKTKTWKQWSGTVGLGLGCMGMSFGLGPAADKID